MSVEGRNRLLAIGLFICLQELRQGRPRLSEVTSTGVDPLGPVTRRLDELIRLDPVGPHEQHILHSHIRPLHRQIAALRHEATPVDQLWIRGLDPGQHGTHIRVTHVHRLSRHYLPSQGLKRLGKLLTQLLSVRTTIVYRRYPVYP